MVQHLILVALATPLIVIGKPERAIRAMIGTPPHKVIKPQPYGNRQLFPATLAYGASIWLWHIPLFYQSALTSALIHLIYLYSLLGLSLWFWHCVLFAPSKVLLSVALALLATMIHTGILGALLTFAPSPWYPVLASNSMAWGLLPIEDQQLAGMIMWIPMGLIYLLAALYAAQNCLQIRDSQIRDSSARSTP
jgi:cytochrome c oxidase assembly factor CtaG